MSAVKENAAAAPALRPAARVVGQTAYRVKHHPAPVELDLYANEGASVAPQLLTPELRESDILRYPRVASLQALLADRVGIDPKRLVVTAGGDDALERAVRAVAEPGKEVILPTPAYPMLPRYVAQSGAREVGVPWALGEPFPLQEVLGAINERTCALCVVNPQNPSGAVISAKTLGTLCEAMPHGLVIVDLAYTEFADEDLTGVALTYPNAVAVRTLSKAWGLAGLRVGYAMGSPEVVEWLRIVGQPFAVSGPSVAIAEQALRTVDNSGYLQQVRSERKALFDQLAALGQKPFASQANFVLAKFADSDWFYDALAGQGIRVRRFAGRPGLEDAVRISCPGDAARFARLSAAVTTALAPEALLFDMDGVLADVSGSYREAVRATARSYDVTLDDQAISAAKRAGNANDDWQLTQQLLAAAGVERPLAEVTERFEALYQGTSEEPGLWRTERLIPSRELLVALAERLPLAIVTGRPRADAERFLETFHIASCFRVVVTRDEAPLKPDPGPVLLALKELGVQHGWMLGDTPDDVRAARAGRTLPLGVVAPGDAEIMSETLLASGAARVLPTLDELEELLP